MNDLEKLNDLIAEARGELIATADLDHPQIAQRWEALHFAVRDRDAAAIRLESGRLGSAVAAHAPR